MSNRKKPNSTEQVLKEMKRLFAAPVLSSEYPKDYYIIFESIVEDTKPRSFLQQMFAQWAADAVLEVERMKQQKITLIERRHQAHLEMEKKRLQKELEIKARNAYWDAQRAASAEKKKKEQGDPGAADIGAAAGAASPDAAGVNVSPGAGVSAEQDEVETSQLERMAELEGVADDVVTDVDAILSEPADEIDHSRAMEAGLDLYIEFDRLQSIAMARVKDALQQLNFCRQVFGQGPTDEIIDGALSETEQGTRLVPAMKASDE